jgi:hypothetical protein
MHHPTLHGGKMGDRKTRNVELLARDALNLLARPYGEDVIEDVVLAIEASPTLRRRYLDLEAELTTPVVNPWIGRYTKELTGMDSGIQVDAHRATLIKSYTKLTPPG